MYNPAGVLRQSKFKGRSIFHRAELVNIYGEVTKNTRSLYSSLSSTNQLDVESIAKALEDTKNRTLFARAGAFPYVSFLNCQLSFLAENQTRAELVEHDTLTGNAIGSTLTESAGGIAAGTKLTQSQISSLQAKGIKKVEINSMHIDSVANMMPMLAFGIGLMHNQLSLGVNLRYVMRTEINSYIPPMFIADGTFKKNINSYVSKGAGIAVDTGFLYTVNDFWFPSFGIAVRDVSGTTIATSKVAETVGDKTEQVKVRGDSQNVSVGFSIMPRMSRNIAFRLATDVQHMTDAIDFNKKLHFGAELLFGNPLKETFLTLRGGYNQTLWTGGATIDLGFVILEFASYGEEVGQGLNSLEDRRYIAKFGIYL